MVETMDLGGKGQVLIPERIRSRWTKEHIMRYVFASDFIEDDLIVLDNGCGTGYGTHFLGKRTKITVGVDISDVAIDFAQSHYKSDNVHFLRGDSTNLPFRNNVFDVVISFEVIEHIHPSKHTKFFDEVVRILDQRGVFICSTPNKKYAFHPNYHIKEMYPSEFYRKLEKKFRFVKKYAQYIGTIERANEKIIEPKVLGTAGKILDSSSRGRKLKSFLNQKLFGQFKEHSKRVMGIDEVLSKYNSDDFEKHKVVPLKATKFKILKMLLAVCRNE